MYSLLPFLLLQALPLALAQQTVQVGSQGLQFLPDTVFASVGSTVVFDFVAPGHTVVEGTFSKPCQPLGNGSFYSGTGLNIVSVARGNYYANFN